MQRRGLEAFATSLQCNNYPLGERIQQLTLGGIGRCNPTTVGGESGGFV